MSKANSREFASDELGENELNEVNGGAKNLDPVGVWHHLMGQLGVGEPSYGFSAKMQDDLSCVNGM